MNERNDPFARPRRLLKFIVIAGGCLFLIYFVLPSVMDMLGASRSAKRELFLRPSSWDDNSVDPAKTKFSTLVLYGKYNSTAGEYSPARSGEFEIVMRGHDLYFRREWRRRFDDWRWRVEMVANNFYSDISISWRGMGSGGGGAGGYDGKHQVLVGRRMWSETNFIGAVKESLRETTGSSFKKTEEFADLVQYGSFLIPHRIVFENWDERVFTYRVEKVQFRNDPDERWFIERRDKFNFSAEEEKKFLSGARSTTNESPGSPLKPQ